MIGLKLAWSLARVLLATLLLSLASACDDEDADDYAQDAATSDGGLVANLDAGNSTGDADHPVDASCKSSGAGQVDPSPMRKLCGPCPRVRIRADAGAVDCSDTMDVNTYIGSPVYTHQATDIAYAAIKPVHTDPPDDRWRYLQRTRALLCCKGSLQIVMLGDSIIAGTSNSRWDDYLAQATGATIKKITSVRSSTGPAWYQEEPRVYCGAVRQLPDLVVLGGISMLDADASRRVIRQVRRDSPDTEILQLTPAFGARDPADTSTWSYEIDVSKDPIRAQLAGVATEEKVGFLDMTAEWGRYILESGMPVAAFKQDIVHPNAAGEQILGRILTQFLTPTLGGTACDVGP
jgi:hypothetical protein